MDNCIFCKILKGELPSRTILEDDDVKVIMNINPSTNGHLLVIPKKHIVTVNDISNEQISHIMDLVRDKLYPLLKDRLNCKGLTLAQNNDLGQEVKHYHLHLIPRYEDDNADMQYNATLSSLDDVFDKLK